MSSPVLSGPGPAIRFAAQVAPSIVPHIVPQPTTPPWPQTNESTGKDVYGSPTDFCSGFSRPVRAAFMQKPLYHWSYVMSPTSSTFSFLYGHGSGVTFASALARMLLPGDASATVPTARVPAQLSMHRRV